MWVCFVHRKRETGPAGWLYYGSSCSVGCISCVRHPVSKKDPQHISLSRITDFGDEKSTIPPKEGKEKTGRTWMSEHLMMSKTLVSGECLLEQLTLCQKKSFVVKISWCNSFQWNCINIYNSAIFFIVLAAFLVLKTWAFSLFSMEILEQL